MKHKIFTLFFALVASIGTMLGEKIQIDDLYYWIDGTNKTAIVLSGANKYSGDIVIPSSILYNGIDYSVTSIGEYAFFQCYSLASVSICNSVTSIGEYAFYGCSGLTSITIPDGVTSFENKAFYGCSSLTSVNIPNQRPVVHLPRRYDLQRIGYAG